MDRRQFMLGTAASVAVTALGVPTMRAESGTIFFNHPGWTNIDMPMGIRLESGEVYAIHCTADNPSDCWIEDEHGNRLGGEA